MTPVEAAGAPPGSQRRRGARRESLLGRARIIAKDMIYSHAHGDFVFTVAML